MPLGYLSRKKESQSRPIPQRNTPAVPVSHSSSSLASSFSSYAPSSVLPAATPSNSSRSDILSDHSVASRSPSTSPKTRFFPVSISPTVRTSPLAHMGQGSSRPDSGSPDSVTPPVLPATVSATSLASPSRLKRIWPGRRKRSEDVTSVFGHPNESSDFKGKTRDYDSSASSSTFPTPASSVDHFQVHPSDSAHPPSHTKRPLTLQLSGSVSSLSGNEPLTTSSSSSEFSGPPPIPPVPPPKFVQLQTSSKASLTPGDDETTEGATSPLMSLSPGSAAAVQFMHNQGHTLSPGLKERSESDMKQDWRKSDSTVMSYVTIRPGALGSRSPRPVSLAESSHSGHTVVPVNRRLSALITDAEFAMAEEGDSDSEQDVVRIPIPGRPSPASSVKARNRRSASLNLGPGYMAQQMLNDTSGPRAASSMGMAMPRLSRTFTEGPRLPPAASTSRETPTLSRAAATGVMASTVGNPVQSSTTNIRGRLAAWTIPSSPGRHALPSPEMRRPMPPTTPQKQHAAGVSGVLAPAALGFGRRAAEKVQRVWEGLSSGSSTHSSSPSTGGAFLDSRAPSRQSIYAHQPSIPGGWRPRRRTPEASSGSWSIASSVASSSESDAFSTPATLSLGTCIRGPKRNAVGMNVIGGVVFGRNLRECVRETAIDPVRMLLDPNDVREYDGIKPLEQRMLPAIVVRCYQHLMNWGLQEEGLFRIPGRASHLAKLRSEFDNGADFDLVQCDPSDLDPHAVASIFKAYLRELPESLLTAALASHFESSLPKESDAAQAASFSRGQLPLLRKPPSLSTLAMPSFAGQRSVSHQTVSELATLIAQMPVENRDLLYTVVELISATAAHHKETKMPLGNLLLLFCPTLGVSHTLLRVLCEATDIWAPPKEPPSPKAPETSQVELNVSHAVLTSPSGSSSSLSLDTDSSSEFSDLPAPRRRLGKVRRGPVKTLLYVPDGTASPYYSSSNSGSIQDDASYVSALDRSPARSHDSSPNLPALSTSTDSIATPSTMSEVSSLQQPAEAPSADEAVKDIPNGAPEETTDDIDLSLPAVRRRPFISSPVPFPSSGSSLPQSPQTPSSTARKSLALLSFPPLNKSDSSGSLPGLRAKRPSLTLLFSKRSMSSLASPRSAKPSDEPTATRSDTLQIPVSPHTRSVSPVAPVLDTPISSSPINLFDATADHKLKEAAEQRSLPGLLTANDSRWQGRDRADSSSGSSLFSTPQQTPIADFFRGRTSSIISVLDDRNEALRATTPSIEPEPPIAATERAQSPSIDVELESAVEDDWAQSVIKEAAASSTTTDTAKPSWRVMDAIGLF